MSATRAAMVTGASPWAIRHTGRIVNHKTVQRLMGEMQLKSLVRPKRYRSWRGEVGRIAPNL
ncbi:hypothetical protein BURKHO8Y_520151 [Burkholderia sp. 8Y]|nr:hypothetical protein BURKHO8Y_520151 [Burkholderia sp. 8Y]